MNAVRSLESLGFVPGAAGDLESRSPIDGRVLGRVATATRADYDRAIEAIVRPYSWRESPTA